MRILDEEKLREFSKNTYLFANTMIDNEFQNWGHSIQGDVKDSDCAERLGFPDMFKFALREGVTWEQMVNELSTIEDRRVRDYAVTRVINIRAAVSDESVFGMCDGIELNPNPYDPKWDFAIQGHRLDLKSTVLPVNASKFGEFANNWDAIRENPQELIRRMYLFQSSGVRTHRTMNNRFFLFNKSFVSDKNTFLLKSGYRGRPEIIKEIVRNFTDDNLFSVDNVYIKKFDAIYNGVQSVLAIIFEKEDGTFSYEILKGNYKDVTSNN